jgi:hypothetical protein
MSEATSERVADGRDGVGFKQVVAEYRQQWQFDGSRETIVRLGALPLLDVGFSLQHRVLDLLQ